MRVQLISDLHLETGEPFQPQHAPGAEVLVLAGDIGSYQAGSQLAGDDFGLGRFSPMAAGAPWKTVLFVPGNHEYDGLDFDTADARLRAVCERLGITWLERRSVTLGHVRFIGATLWSDFDALADVPAVLAKPVKSAKRGHRSPPPASPDSLLTERLRLREKAYRAANFYLRKNSSLRDGQPLLAEDLRALGLASQAWLREALAEPFAGTTVVVTHFAPSLRSADPRYGLSPGTAGFCNSLDDLLPAAQLWLHGHLHCHHDYGVGGQHADGQSWHCRVVANPLGYARKQEQATYRPQWCVDLPDGPRPVAAPATASPLLGTLHG